MRVDDRAAYVMRVDYRARVTRAAATPAVKKVYVATPPAPGLERFGHFYDTLALKWLCSVTSCR
jgi:hypothetical protein